MDTLDLTSFSLAKTSRPSRVALYAVKLVEFPASVPRNHALQPVCLDTPDDAEGSLLSPTDVVVGRRAALIMREFT